MRPVLLVLACAVLLTGAADAPAATLSRERGVDNAYRQGLAHFGDGWIFSGTNGLWRVADDLHVEVANTSPIPDDLRGRGYDRIGDVDVAGAYLYVPLAQPDDRRDEQVVARYDAKTLRFIDSVTLRQHEIAFVSVDAQSGTAYSMGRLGGDEVLRYDLGGLRWRRLPSLHLGRRVLVEGGSRSGHGREHGAARLAETERALHVARHEGALDGHRAGRPSPDQAEALGVEARASGVHPAATGA